MLGSLEKEILLLDVQGNKGRKMGDGFCRRWHLGQTMKDG